MRGCRIAVDRGPAFPVVEKPNQHQRICDGSLAHSRHQPGRAGRARNVAALAAHCPGNYAGVLSIEFF